MALGKMRTSAKGAHVTKLLILNYCQETHISSNVQYGGLGVIFHPGWTHIHDRCYFLWLII